MILADGTQINLSPLTEKTILDIEDVRQRKPFEKLSGRFDNINYDNSRWQATLRIKTRQQDDAEVMRTLSTQETFTISPGELCDEEGSHGNLPFLEGGRVYVAGDLRIRTSGRAANQSLYEMSLPLLLIEEPAAIPDEAPVEGNVFEIDNDDGTMDIGVDGEIKILPTSLAKERTALNFIDGSRQQINYNQELRTAVNLQFITTNPAMIKVVELLRTKEKFRLRPSAFASAVAPTARIEGLDPTNLFDCEFNGGVSIRTATNNYKAGAYEMRFSILIYNRDNQEYINALIEFMREFVAFVYGDPSWDWWEINALIGRMRGFVGFWADDKNFEI